MDRGWDFMNFFFGVINKSYEEKLDRLYLRDKYSYDKEVNNVKNAGYKVMRNSQGKHKVINKKDD